MNYSTVDSSGGLSTGRAGVAETLARPNLSPPDATGRGAVSSVWLKALTFLSLGALSVSMAPGQELILITLTDNQAVVGELTSESDSLLIVTDLSTGKPREISLDDIQHIQHDISVDDAIDAVGLGEVVAWKAKALLPEVVRRRGAVAQIDGGEIWITLGSDHHMVRGDKVNISRSLGEITDPQTNRVLGQRMRKVAVGTVINVQPQTSEVRFFAGRRDVKVGDTVEPIRNFVTRDAIAVMPFVNLDDIEVTAGKQLAEDLTTTLVNNGVNVVERFLLRRVLNELSFQNSKLVDPLTANRYGQLVGAAALLTGTLDPQGDQADVKIRLIDVATGKIQFAATRRFDFVDSGFDPVAKQLEEDDLPGVWTFEKHDGPADSKNLVVIFSDLSFRGSGGESGRIELTGGGGVMRYDNEVTIHWSLDGQQIRFTKHHPPDHREVDRGFVRRVDSIIQRLPENMVGRWTVRYGNGTSRNYDVGIDNLVIVDGQSHQLYKTEFGLVAVFFNGKYELFELVDEQLRVRHFNLQQGARFPRNPNLIGVGRKAN